MIEYMNSCSGHGTPDTTTGTCTCDSGYYGADCMTTITQFSDSASKSKTESAYGTQWFYYGVPAGASFNLFVENMNYPVDVFIKLGTDTIPDNSNFDSVIKKQSGSVELTEFTMDFSEGAIIAVHTTEKVVNDETTNFTVAFEPHSSGREVALDNHFIQRFAASAAVAQPLPPQYEYPDDYNMKDD